MQLHTELGPNIGTTFIPAGPIWIMFFYFTIKYFLLQCDPLQYT